MHVREFQVVLYLRSDTSHELYSLMASRVLLWMAKIQIREVANELWKAGLLLYAVLGID